MRVPLTHRLTPLAILLACLAGCQAAPPAGERWVRSELYFGQTTRAGEPVPAEAWQAFLNDEVTPRFPQGLTVVDAQGQWRYDTGAVGREASKVLIVIYPASDAAAADAKLDAIADRWCERFDQEAVLRIDSGAVATFESAGD